ncbi:MAG: hypothetical protein WC602_00650 [archaeon]
MNSGKAELLCLGAGQADCKLVKTILVRFDLETPGKLSNPAPTLFAVDGTALFYALLSGSAVDSRIMVIPGDSGFLFRELNPLRNTMNTSSRWARLQKASQPWTMQGRNSNSPRTPSLQGMEPLEANASGGFTL